MKCGIAGMARSVTEAQIHDDGRMEEMQQEFTAVHGFTFAARISVLSGV